MQEYDKILQVQTINPSLKVFQRPKYKGIIIYEILRLSGDKEVTC